VEHAASKDLTEAFKCVNVRLLVLTLFRDGTHKIQSVGNVCRFMSDVGTMRYDAVGILTVRFFDFPSTPFRSSPIERLKTLNERDSYEKT